MWTLSEIFFGLVSVSGIAVTSVIITGYIYGFE